MKVKHLIKILSKLDPELDAGYMHNDGVFSADTVGVYEGLFYGPNGNKPTKQKYLLLGNPGDFGDELASHDVNTPKHTFEVYEDGTIEEDTRPEYNMIYPTRKIREVDSVTAKFNYRDGEKILQESCTSSRKSG